MKILVLTTTFPRWKDDKVPPFVYELSRRLAKRGLEIIVLAPHHEGAKRFENMENMKVYRFPYFYPAKYQKLAYGGGISENLKKNNLIKLQIPFFILMAFIYSAWLIRREDIDVIHSHWIIPCGLIGGVLGKILGRKHVSTAHAADVFKLNRLPLKRYLADIILSCTNAMTASSSHIKETYIEILSPRHRRKAESMIHVQPMGVDLGLFDNLEKNELRKRYGVGDCLLILFVGRFAEKKGIPYLLNAVKILSSNKQTEKIKLLMIGEGALEGELKDIASTSGILDLVSFTGWMEKKRLAEHYVMADIVVVPSIVDTTGDTEGMPTVITESMASGTVVISSDVSGIRDVVIDGFNGFIIKEKDPGEIARKIKEVMDDRLLYETISRNAIKTARNYDWDDVSSSFIKLLNKN